ncbi:MAG: replication associated protein [Wigfec virus K19_545]|nr:MAG: replication associated protein [Wigfec virus K19_545]
MSVSELVSEDNFSQEKRPDDTGKFRFQNQRVLLTYGKQEDKKVFTAWFKKNFPVNEIHIAHEIGKESGREHMHVLVDFGKRFQTNEFRKFDYKGWGDVPESHPNIKPVKNPWPKNWANAKNYLAKEDPENAHLKVVGGCPQFLKALWECKNVQEAIGNHIGIDPQSGNIKWSDVSGIEKAYALRPRDEIKVIYPSYPWQQELYEELKGEPNDRKVNWYYDPVGGSGKTQFAKYLMVTYPDQYYVVSQTNGMKDFATIIANAIDGGWKNHGLIFNLARSDAELKIYKPIESIKDGLLTSVKYSGKTMVFNCPHVVVFANFLPDTEKLSKDRWVIRKISGQRSEPITLNEAQIIKGVDDNGLLGRTAKPS